MSLVKVGKNDFVKAFAIQYISITNRLMLS